MVRMGIAQFSNAMKFDVKGKIKAGCKCIKAKCPLCKKEVVALKLHDHFECPDCAGSVTPLAGAREFTKATPYFVLPQELASILGDKPVSLKVIPAYPEIEKTFPTSYAKFTQAGKIFCTGNGETAKRWDAGKRSQVEVPCTGDCQERKNKTCKPSGTFYMVLPDVDIFVSYAIVSHSVISINGIMSSLNKLAALNKLQGAKDGSIVRTECTLKVKGVTKTVGNEKYYVLSLELPPISRNDVGRQGVAFGGGAPQLPYSPAGRWNCLRSRLKLPVR